MTHNDHTCEVIDLSPSLRVRIEYDQDPMSPDEWDNVGQIAYTSDRYVLGTEHVDRDRMEEISEGIEDGSLIGLPVYAYVHGGATISCGAFSCPWDSGMSGYVYCTKEEAIKEWGKKILTKKVEAAALKYLRGSVETYDQYLTGDVYTVAVERVERDDDGDELDSDWLDSCSGFYGLKYAREEAESMGKHQLAQDAKEAAEAQHWLERGMVTV